MTSIALLTKTRRADFDALGRLLNSLRLAGSTMHHLIVVDDEDLAEAEARFSSFSAELTAESFFLPAWYRRSAQVNSRVVKLRAAPGALGAIGRVVSKATRLLCGDPNGWWGQQVVKLSCCVAQPSVTYVSVDSDVVFLQAPAPEWFISEDGRPKLFVSDAHSLKELEWKLRAHRFLGIDRFGDAPSTYVTFPQVLHAPFVVELVALLQRGGPGPWWATMLRRRLTEYELYGSFTQFSASTCERVAVERISWSHEVSSWRTEASLSELEARLRGTSPPWAVCVQSNLDLASKVCAWSLLDQHLGTE